jgi:hypothetical protein
MPIKGGRVAIIDLQHLDIEVIDVPRNELFNALDEECQKFLGMSGSEFIEALRAGRAIDHPAADRLAVLAGALSDTE